MLFIMGNEIILHEPEIIAKDGKAYYRGVYYLIPSGCKFW